MIKVTNLLKEIDNQVILNNISIDVKKGEILVILGESGSGKSVLLKHLIGLLRPDKGTIEVKGIDITKCSEKKMLNIRKDIGFLFQEGALYDFMTVFENVAFPLQEHTKLNKERISKKVYEILNMVGLEEAAGKFPAELSGGMKKRVALARSIILDSKILFCDEPTSGLDPIKSRDISNLIYDISRKLECTTIVTSHDVHNSFRIADRLALIREGKIVFMGTQKELQSSKDFFMKEFLR